MRHWLLLDAIFLAKTALLYSVPPLVTIALVLGRLRLGRNDVAVVAKLMLLYAVHLLVSMALVWGTWYYFASVDGSLYANDSLNFYAFNLAAALTLAVRDGRVMTELRKQQQWNATFARD